MKYRESISIADSIKFPKSFVTDISLYAGIRKYGKSYAVGVQEEEFKLAKWPFIIIDPMGIHYALREYYNSVIIMGGPNEDLGLSDANILKVIKNRENVVFDLSEHPIEEQQLLCTSILECVKDISREPINIIMEESDIFAPQAKGNPDCKAVITWLVRKGRQHGVGMTLMCQRLSGRQSIDKDIMSQVDNYFIFKTDAPSDMPTLKKLVDKEAIKKITAFKPGDCYIKSSYYTGVCRIKKRKNTHQGFTPVLGEVRDELIIKELGVRIRDRMIDKETILDKISRILNI